MILNQSIIRGGTRQAPPDGSLFPAAGCVFHQRPPQYTGWRFYGNLETHGLTETKNSD
jgi:hypothetical protein